MPDRMTPEQRHDCMASIHSEDTRPEQAVRRELWHRGYRFRKCVRTLPGTPDIVLPKYRTCIFVNGCFWHGHKGCSKFVMPKTRTEFWANKIARNQERDLVNIQRLESIGWSAITVWECELGKSSIENTMEKIESMLEENRTKWEAYQAHRRESRKFAIEQARRRREVNAIIEAELKERFSIPERIRRLSRIDEDLL
uniref:very short patch repair endonuclease n=1 Tax=Candidatus Cryptobacteroides bacterium TaxID=3085639 RepID=UPI004027C093